MTEAADNPSPIGTTGLAGSAGALIRAAREQRGLHIAALAAAIKVPQRKLEALENDRYDELLDLTFTRALAQTVCRSLKVDAQPVLDRLPQASGTAPKLQHVSNGLNAPFREKSGDDGMDWSWLRRPVFWGTLLVLAAAAAVAFMPERFFGMLRGAGAAVPTPAVPAAAPAAVAATPAASAVVSLPPAADNSTPTALGAPATVEAPASAVAPSSAVKPVGSALLAVKVASESWVEVQDAKGQTLLSRKVAAGEALGLDGEVPLRLTIGNAAATQVIFRGQPVDLSSNTVANVARLQLN
jgi:cytoskeleton protein RodZ